MAKVSRAPRDQPIPSARFQSIRIGVQFQLVDTLNLILMTSSKSIIFLSGLFFEIFQYSYYSSCSCVCHAYIFGSKFSFEVSTGQKCHNLDLTIMHKFELCAVGRCVSWRMYKLEDVPFRGYDNWRTLTYRIFWVQFSFLTPM